MQINFIFVKFIFNAFLLLIHSLLCSNKMQQIQSSASNVGQANIPNISTAGNLRNPTVTGSINGTMMSQAAMQSNMGAGGLPFNSGNLQASMMNSGMYFSHHGIEQLKYEKN